MGEHILVPYDSSDVATKALEYALERYPDADVTVVHVVTLDHTDSYLATYMGEEELDRLVTERVDEILSAAEDVADESGRRVETVVREGDPVDEIVDCVADRNADLVVVGTHGRTGLSHTLYGSVAERLVRHSTVPVLTVPASSDETDQGD